MSGVCGVVSWDAPVTASLVGAMVAAAPWRAAEGSELWSGEGAVLGFGRLAVTPEDDLETQPFHDDRVVVVADCRLDDRRPLIDRLEDMGPWRWGVPTDVELISRAYRRWGTDCAGHLLGDFAFVIWDHRARRLVAARDPMGMRPLYYHAAPGRIVFGSEIKQILAHPEIPRRIHEPFVAAHLAGIFGPLEWTAYEGVAQLAPATTLIADGDRRRIHTHWQPDPGHRIDLDSEGEYAALLRDTLAAAVRDRLRTNRPPGVLLSGGMDSGSVAALAGHLRNADRALPLLQTYSWAFTELIECDERHVSRHITDHYQLPATDIEADHLWPLAHHPDHGPDPDDPFVGAFQPLLEHALATAAEDGTRLMLGGTRGDLMVGPEMYLATRVAQGRLNDAATGLRQLARLSGGTTAFAEAVRSVRPVLGAVRRRLAARRGSEDSSTGPPWLDRSFTERIGLADMDRQTGPPGPYEGVRGDRHALIFTLLQMRVAVWLNRTYARAGLVSADPFSDRRVAALALAVPQMLLDRPDKPLLRLAMSGVMPEPARTAATKTLPTPLYHRGLSQGGRHLIVHLLDTSRAAQAGWVDGGAALASYRDYLATGRDDPLLWQLVSLELWLRQGTVLNNSLSPSPRTPRPGTIPMEDGGSRCCSTPSDLGPTTPRPGG